MTLGDDPISRQLGKARLAPNKETRLLRAKVQAELFGDPAARPKLERFVLLRELGRGAMGVVYAAYDPELDRKVALKVVRVDAQRAGAQEMLLAEARSAASLVHPNVVSVYEVGVVDTDVFIAMEYVDGGTLEPWCQPDHSPEEALELFIQAGHGLAAAHAAGLVHRDFKPANVLVGNDTTGQRRARVADFGLAHNIAADAGKGGTPAYMSPEQHAGEALDERSDQFSFCVALWQALYKTRPFGSTVDPSAEPEGAPTRQVPPHVREACQRGMSADRADRFPDMAALLEALTVDPRAKRRRWILGSALALLVVGAVVALVVARSTSRAEVCPIDESSVIGLWDAERKHALRTGFEASGAPAWASVWALFSKSIDQYTERIQTMQRDSCRATHVLGQQSDRLLDLRAECLQSRLHAVRELVTALNKPSGEVIGKAVSAAQKLPAVDHCAETAALSRRPPPPADKRALVAEQRNHVVRARTLRDLGRYPEALALARKTAERARDLGYMPLTGEALLIYGSVQVATGAYKASTPVLHEALAAGIEGRSHWLVAKVSTLLVWSLGYWQGDTANAAVWERVAEASLAAVGGDPAVEASLREHQGAIAYQAENYALAESKSRHSLAIVERAFGPRDVRVARSLVNLSAALNRRKKFSESERILRRALAIFRGAYGNEHPHVAVALGNLGVTIRDPERRNEALDLFRESLRIRERTLGMNHPSLTSPITKISHLLADMKRYEESLAFTKRGIALALRRFGPGHQLTHSYQLDAMITSLDMGRFDDALAYANRGLEGVEQGKGETRARFLTMKARALVELGRFDEAFAAGTKALASYGPKHKYSEDLGETRFAMAKALWAKGKRAQARTMAKQALALYRRASQKTEAKRVTDWLAQPRR